MTVRFSFVITVLGVFALAACQRGPTPLSDARHNLCAVYHRCERLL